MIKTGATTIKNIMKMIKAVMKRKKLSREQLADHMSKELGSEIPVTTLDLWFKYSRPDMKPNAIQLLAIFDFVGGEGWLMVTKNEGIYIEQGLEAEAAAKRFKQMRV